ncbi:MAG: PaaI family thioesterase [Archangium sp.]|nr:PaaI family thioesterase [Archangium sp.]
MSERIDLAAVNATIRATVPQNKALGLELTEASYTPAVAVMRLPWNDALIGNPETRVLHGGVITTLIDACCGAAVYCKLKSTIPIATLDLRVDFMKPATPERDVFARAECFHATHNVAFVRAVVFHGPGEAPIASAAGTFMVSTKSGAGTRSAP